MKSFIIFVACWTLVSLGAFKVEAAVWKQNKFIITYWCPPPPTKQALTAAAKEGFNLTWTDDLMWSDDYGLNAVRGQGMMAMLQDPLLTPATLDNPEKRSALDALINRVKNNPSLESYYLADEPSASEFPSLGKLVAYLRERDPAHFAYINLFPIYADNKQLGTNGPPIEAYKEYLQRYIDEVKPSLISFDHYHFFKAGDGDKYFLNLELIRQTAIKNGLPFMNIIQSSTMINTWRLVNANELRWQVYTTLAYGGRGISYFLYWGPPAYGGLYRGGVRTPLTDFVAPLNKEMAKLGPILLQLDSIGVYHTGPLPIGAKPVPQSSPVQFTGPGSFVLGLFGSSSSITAFMVVNRDYRNRSVVKLALDSVVQSVEEFDRDTNSWKKLALGSKHDISIVLNPGDGRLFRLLQNVQYKRESKTRKKRTP